MAEDSLKNKTTKGMFWSAFDKIFVQAGQIIITILLARLLTPEAFGLIGMLSIFLVISDVLVNSGLESGLIQKTNRTNTDFSTVFVFNAAISILIYLLLFISAPLISRFYNVPELVLLIRVLCTVIIINSLSVVQRAKLTISIDFKTMTKIRALSIILGGLIGIFFAFKGYGVWALVIHNISGSLISVIFFWIFSKWSPSLHFSVESFKSLFGYSSKLLLSSLYSQTISNIYSVIIGKEYSATLLGYYTNAKRFSEISSGIVTGVIQQVTFPILASLQDDRQRLLSIYSRLIRMATFLVFPLMTMIALLAEPLISVFLTDKWLPVVPLLQWMCFATVNYPLAMLNLNILNAVGRSDLFLKVNLSKSPFLIAALIITIPLGVKAIVIGYFCTSLISFFINTYFPGKIFGYGAKKQLQDMAPYILATGIMALFAFFSIYYIEHSILKLLIGSFVGIISYFFICYILKLNEIQELKALFFRLKNLT